MGSGSGKTVTMRSEDFVDLTRVARMLLTSLYQIGIMDDYDEIIRDVFTNEGIDAAVQYHLSVIESIKVINKHHPDKHNDPIKCDKLTHTFYAQCGIEFNKRLAELFKS